MNLTVIGIGQTLRGDDAAGIEAVRRWQEAYPATASRTDITAQFSELPGLALIDMLDGYDAAIIVDAVKSSAEPGLIHRLRPEDLATFEPDAKSAHGWGIAETLKLGWQLDPARQPSAVHLIGIEGQQMDLGSPLSSAVERALSLVCRTIQETVEALFSSRSASPTE